MKIKVPYPELIKNNENMMLSFTDKNGNSLYCKDYVEFTITNNNMTEKFIGRIDYDYTIEEYYIRTIEEDMSKHTRFYVLFNKNKKYNSSLYSEQANHYYRFYDGFVFNDQIISLQNIYNKENNNKQIFKLSDTDLIDYNYNKLYLTGNLNISPAYIDFNKNKKVNCNNHKSGPIIERGELLKKQISDMIFGISTHYKDVNDIEIFIGDYVIFTNQNILTEFENKDKYDERLKIKIDNFDPNEFDKYDNIGIVCNADDKIDSPYIKMTINNPLVHPRKFEILVPLSELNYYEKIFINDKINELQIIGSNIIRDDNVDIEKIKKLEIVKKAFVDMKAGNYKDYYQNNTYIKVRNYILQDKDHYFTMKGFCDSLEIQLGINNKNIKDKESVFLPKELEMIESTCKIYNINKDKLFSNILQEYYNFINDEVYERYVYKQTIVTNNNEITFELKFDRSKEKIALINIKISDC